MEESTRNTVQENSMNTPTETTAKKRGRPKKPSSTVNPTQELDIRQFRTLFPMESILNLDDDFFIAEIVYRKSTVQIDHPCKFDGYLALFCIEGSLDLDVNLTTYHLQSSSFLVTLPGYIIRLSGNEIADEHMRCYLVASSKRFMSTIHMDFNRLFNEAMSLMSRPVISLGPKEIDILTKYVDLAVNLANSGLEDPSSAISPLLSSLLYASGALWSKKLTEASEVHRSSSIRSKVILENFLSLVRQYHTQQRGMEFYADKMCLTPKYLSKVVKNASGRSAPDWIDSFVILEAKNMLKYSDMAIKEIVQRLNFPNQSVFYKFFKAHTSYTPTEYRNS